MSAHGQERAIIVGDAGHHAYLLPAQPSLGCGRAAMPRRTQKPELATGVVVLEALA